MFDRIVDSNVRLINVKLKDDWPLVTYHPSPV